MILTRPWVRERERERERKLFNFVGSSWENGSCVPAGISYVRRVFLFYCNLCHKYVTRQGVPEGNLEQEEASRVEMRQHCKSRQHQAALFKKEREKEAEMEEGSKQGDKEEEEVAEQVRRRSRLLLPK